MPLEGNLHKCIKSVAPEQSVLGPLPLVHVSKAINLPSIICDKKLIPKQGKKFNEKLTYFFYGNAFYRYNEDENETPDLSKLPVAFMFKGNLLQNEARAFPCDTGGVGNGYYGNWDVLLQDFERYTIADTQNKFAGSNYPEDSCLDTISQFIEYVFGYHDRYLKGKPTVLFPDPEHKCDLFNIVEMYNDESIKKEPRRRCIECQFDSSIHLDDKLIWMAIPEHLEGIVRLFMIQNHMNFEISKYEWDADEPLDKILTKVQNKSREAVKRYSA
jgi:hypothetical protein